MQEDTSWPPAELLDGETILMDVCKIQGLNRYFAKFRDEFGWLVKIQVRIWGITPLNFVGKIWYTIKKVKIHVYLYI